MNPLHASLLTWFDAHQRDLPWRRNKDPYSIWVSEIMLQQTQVATVIPYFDRWMARFPTIEALAAASEAEVLAMWQGLGYYRRARSLLAGARFISEGHAGCVRSRDEWLEVPGVGPYTAGAIASIAFDEAVPLVDGNVERVFARLSACDATGADLKKKAWEWATESVHPTRPGDWNQALMELGATVCKPFDPQCQLCPVSTFCRAFQTGRQDELPVATPKRKAVSLTHYVWIPVHQESVGIRQIPANEWWAGMWEFVRSAEPTYLEELLPNTWPEEVGSFKHTVTHHRIEVRVALVRMEERNPALTWVPLENLGDYALPSPQRKALAMGKKRLGIA